MSSFLEIIFSVFLVVILTVTVLALFHSFENAMHNKLNANITKLGDLAHSTTESPSLQRFMKLREAHVLLQNALDGQLELYNPSGNIFTWIWRWTLYAVNVRSAANAVEFSDHALQWSIIKAHLYKDK